MYIFGTSKNFTWQAKIVHSSSTSLRDPIPGLVTVIIPTFNRLRWVLEAIQSVKQQTYSKVQLIVVDDGSTDGTQDFVQQIENLKYIRQDNQGQASARNRGLQEAEGEFVCTLDSDDVLKPEFLDVMVKAMQSLSVDIAFANWTAIDLFGAPYKSYFEEFYHWTDFSEVRPNWRVMAPLESRAMLLDSCISPSSGIVFRRNALCHGWEQNLNIADDWCVLLDNVITKPTAIAFTIDHLWVKRITGDNIYDGRDPLVVHKELLYEDTWFLYRRYAGLFNRGERAKIARRLIHSSVFMAIRELRDRNYRLALSALWLAFAAVMNAFTNAPVSFIFKFTKAVSINLFRCASRIERGLLSRSLSSALPSPNSNTV